MTGSISIFGGRSDLEDSKENKKGCKPEDVHRTEGLSIYDTHEKADEWPDLFLPRNMEDPEEGTFRRLRPDGLYFAYRFGNQLSKLQLSRIPWIFTNPANKLRVMLRLVDFGPALHTKRTFDISPYAAKLLKLSSEKLDSKGRPIDDGTGKIITGFPIV